MASSSSWLLERTCVSCGHARDFSYLYIQIMHYVYGCVICTARKRRRYHLSWRMPPPLSYGSNHSDLRLVRVSIVFSIFLQISCVFLFDISERNDAQELYYLICYLMDSAILAVQLKRTDFSSHGLSTVI